MRVATTSAPRDPVLREQHVCRLHEARQGQPDRLRAVHQKSCAFRLVGREPTR